MATKRTWKEAWDQIGSAAKRDHVRQLCADLATARRALDRLTRQTEKTERQLDRLMGGAYSDEYDPEADACVKLASAGER